MKKLMIAMSAAAIVALGAQAENTTLQGGVDFETGYTADAALTLSAYGADAFVMWDGAVGESTIKAESDPANKYLAVDTTEPLQRLVSPADATSATATPIADGVVMSAKVQFTGADEAPTPGEGDKLLVWAQAVEGEDSTLMVTAMDDTLGTPKNFETTTKVADNQWYELTIEAVPVTDKMAPVQFTVKLGTATVGTYTSLVAKGETGAATISSMGFQGTGAVDDIVFEAMEPAVEDVAVAVAGLDDGEGTTIGTATIKVGEDFVDITEETTIKADVESVVIKVTAATGYELKSVSYMLTDEEAEGGMREVPLKIAEDGTVTVPVAAANDGGAITLMAVIEAASTPIDVEPAAGKVEATVAAADEATAKATVIAAIKAPAGVEAATYQAYFKATAVAAGEGSYKVTVELDETKVQPTAEADDEESIADGAVAVTTKAGLYYQLIRGATVDAIATTVAEVAGDGTKQTLNDTTPKAAAAFYKIGVTAAPTAVK